MTKEKSWSAGYSVAPAPSSTGSIWNNANILPVFFHPSLSQKTRQDYFTNCIIIIIIIVIIVIIIIIIIITIIIIVVVVVRRREEEEEDSGHGELRHFEWLTLTRVAIRTRAPSQSLRNKNRKRRENTNRES